MDWKSFGHGMATKRGRGLRGMDLGAIKQPQPRQFGTELPSNIVDHQSHRIAKKRTFQQFEEQKEAESVEAQPAKRRRYNLRSNALGAKDRGKENVSGRQTSKTMEPEHDSDEDIDLAAPPKASKTERDHPLRRSQRLQNKRTLRSQRLQNKTAAEEEAPAFAAVVAPEALECDAVAEDDDLAVPAYSAEIVAWLQHCERSAFSRGLIRADYLSSRFQPDLNDSMRSILVDWLFNVHRRFQLCDRTLYTAIYVLDGYLSLVPLKRNQLQLMGCTALWIASKYHEIYAPEASDFVYISDHSFSTEDLFAAEVAILVATEFKFADIITPLHFLERYQQIATHPLSQKYRSRGTAKALRDGQRYIALVTELSNYFGHLALFDSRLLSHRPSIVAAAALCYTVLAISLYSRWPEFLAKRTGFSYADLKPLLKRLSQLRKTAVAGKRMVSLQKMHKSIAKWLGRLNNDAVLRNGSAARKTAK